MSEPQLLESDPSRVAELEARYGSDEALGVEWSEEEQRSFLPDGEPAVICGFCAAYIVRLEGAGKVVGFYDGVNPTAHAAGYTGGAHDFALIDDRYIVDPWVKETGLTSKPAVRGGPASLYSQTGSVNWTGEHQAAARSGRGRDIRFVGRLIGETGVRWRHVAPGPCVGSGLDWTSQHNKQFRTPGQCVGFADWGIA